MSTDSESADEAEAEADDESTPHAETPTTPKAITLPAYPVDPAWAGTGTQEERRALWEKTRPLVRTVLEQCRQVANRVARCLTRIDCQPPVIEPKTPATNKEDVRKFRAAFSMKKIRQLAKAAEDETTATPEKRIEAAFQRLALVFNPKQAKKKWTATIHFDIRGGMPWTVVVADGKCSVKKGNLGEPSCVITIDERVHAAVVAGKKKPESLFTVIEEDRLSLPPMPPLVAENLPGGKSLYLNACDIAPSLSTGSVAAIVDAVQTSYNNDRFDVFVGNQSWRCYSSMPYPIRSQELRTKPRRLEREPAAPRRELVERGGPGGPLEIWIPLNDPETGKRVWTCWRLRCGGRRYGRAAAGARKMARGEIDLRCAYLMMKDGEPYIKLVGRFPVRANSEVKGRLLVATAPDALLRYAQDRSGGQIGACRYDQILRLMAQRRKLIQNLADDMKFERRVPRRQRLRMFGANEPRLRRINGAIKDNLRRAAKEIVNVAVRRRCAELVYRDLLPAAEREGKKAPWRDDAWCPGLAWYELRDRIKTLCAEQGIQFSYDEGGSAVPARWSVSDKIAEHLEQVEDE